MEICTSWLTERGICSDRVAGLPHAKEEKRREKGICGGRIQNKEKETGMKKTDKSFFERIASKIPDPDLLIRTGGEMRISNYLLWQIAYSEFIVIKEFWPEFNKSKLAECLKEFNNRSRRFGS